MWTFLLINAGYGLDIAWPQPPPPPGTNPATFAEPRLDWLERFQSNLNQSRGKQFDLVFDGDSITDNWHGAGREVWAQRYGSLHAFNFGIGGDKVEHVLWRLQQGELGGIHPKLIVLMIGTNNTGRDSATQIAEGIKVLVAEYLKRCPEAHLLLLGVFPRAELATDPVRAKIIAINQEIAKLDDGKRVTYLDIGAKFLGSDGSLSTEIMPDRLHPSAQGYQIWADAIQPVIDKYFPKAH